MYRLRDDFSKEQWKLSSGVQEIVSVECRGNEIRLSRGIMGLRTLEGCQADIVMALSDNLEIAVAALLNAGEQAEEAAGFAGSAHPVFLFGPFIFFCLWGKELRAVVEHSDFHRF